ncbi:MAG: acyl-CoA dehydrogenase C-terminal domain-containing protein, partial [Chitinophagaceae bacterium]|nr:acyl-CoA dehydrogenase C-terminal domain-containing protein [Rubrivivax sp.]
VPEEALANATPYLQAFGHVVLAWLWLDVGLAVRAREVMIGDDMKAGKLAAMRYFFAYELPKIDAWLNVVSRREGLCREMQSAWF